MHKTRNAMLGILTLTSVSGVVLAVPTQAAERYIAGVHKAVPERWFTYPYGASYLKRARRLVGYPNIIPYYGSYYAPVDYYNYWAYYAPPYYNFYSGSPYGLNGCLQRPCR